MPDVKDAQFALMLSSREPVQVLLLVNGVPHPMAFPAIPPEKSDRRMVLLKAPVINGGLTVEVAVIEGGKLYAVYDIQRNYQRSWLNGDSIDGEWVIRSIIPK